jgi:hypothetical protein
MTISVSRFEAFSAIKVLDIFSMPLVCTSFPSSILIAYRFGFLMVSQRSCIFHSYFFSLSLYVHLYVLTHILCQALTFGLQFDTVYWRDSWLIF